MRRRLVSLAAVCTICLSASAVDTTALKAKAAAFKARAAAKVEQMAEQMFPKEKVDRARGFFGPVTKKYQPVFDQFNADYLKSTNKMAVVRKYLPQADAALAEAKAMKVPAKYEAEKAEYIQTAEAFLTMVRFTTLFGE